MFKYCGKVHRHEGYTDYEFCDENPRHLYCVSYDADIDEWYGLLLKSEFDDSAFDYEDETLKGEVVSKLVGMIPENDLPV